MNYKIINLVLIAVAVIVVIAWFLLVNQATTYNAFCETNGYDLAGHANGILTCIRVHEKTIDYRLFECAEQCEFTQEEITIDRYLMENDLNIDIEAIANAGKEA